MGLIFGKRLKSVEEDVVSEAVKRKATEDDENPQENCRRLDSIPCDNELDVVSEAVKRKATEDDENPQEKRQRLDSIPCDNELDVVSVAVKRKATEDDENPKEKRRRLDFIPCDNELDVVSEAVKRKATEDDENPQEKRRRLDSIPCDNELPSTSVNTESRNGPEAAVIKRSAKRKAVADDGPVRKKKRTLDPFAMFKAKYQQQEELGEGGFGLVFAGYRKADYLDVAIKHIPKNPEIFYHEDNTGKQIPMEVAVMMKLAAESERHSAHIDLLDWYDLDQELILVLERPMPAVDLLQYINDKGGRLKEKESKIIMRQLLDAAIHLQQKHIFHRDIKVENVLIETCMDGIRVRIIDFGASCFLEEGDAYQYFMGTHVPPECFDKQEYKAGPTTVFQMGVLIYDLVQSTSFRWDLFYQEGQVIRGRLSKNCRDFFKACLHEDPDQRLTLEQLRNHLWMR